MALAACMSSDSDDGAAVHVMSGNPKLSHIRDVFLSRGTRRHGGGMWLLRRACGVCIGTTSCSVHARMHAARHLFGVRVATVLSWC